MQKEPIKASDFILSDSEAFLHRLKLDRPELEPVKAALDRNDLGAAEIACIAHFRTQSIPSPLLQDNADLPKDPDHDTSEADRYLAGHLQDGYNTYDVPETGIDWDGCPLSCLTRFPIFPSLRDALYHTGDSKYLRFIVTHILEYIDAFPIETFIGTNTDEGWITHYRVCRPWYWGMVPGRLSELSQTLKLIRQYPQVTHRELLQILHRLYEEAAYLRQDIRKWVDRRSNAGCALIGSMGTACAILEDFRAADEWLEFDARLLAQYIDQAFYPDGQCIEQTTAYSASVACQIQCLANALRNQKGIEAARDKLAAMVTWAVALGKPTGRHPSFGDNYSRHFTRAIHRPLLSWLGHPWAGAFLDGKNVPPFTVWPVRGQEQWSGYYAMRSDWSEQARFMVVDGGPWGTTHRHGDKLSFALTADGADFIIDPTATRYASNEPDAFLSRQEAGFLHNTITVDGVDEFINSPNETAEPLRNTWEHADSYTLFAAAYSFAPIKAVAWERRILFVDKTYWVLQDVLTGDLDGVRIEQNFQFEKDVEIEFQDDRTLAHAPNGARLALIPLSGSLEPNLQMGDREARTTYWPEGKPHQTRIAEDGERPSSHGRGWTGRWGHKLLPAPAVTYTGRSGLPLMITLALVPIAPGRACKDIPNITSHTAGGETTWILPVAEGALHFVCTPESCSVVNQ